MKRDHKKKIWVLAFIILLAGLFLPIFFGEARTVEDQHGGDPWRNIIYDFQTLFTGILAVGAATFTIIQSRIIDERQQLRHEQLFELQVRKDKLRLARAWGQANSIATARDTMRSLLTRMEHEGDGDLSRENRTLIGGLTLLTNLETSYLSTPEIREVRDLFDGDLHETLNGLQQRLASLAIVYRRLIVSVGQSVQIEDIPGVIHSVQYTTEQRAKDLNRVYALLDHTLRACDEFLVKFESLAKEYKII